MTDPTEPKNPPTADRRRKVPLRTKLAFSAGALQEGMVTAARITTLLFYNQVLGVSASLCGVAFLIASIVDAISDPLVGALSDRARTRWGRRHPFMLASALPIVCFFYLLYQPPTGLGLTATFAWLVTFLILLRVATSFQNVPRDALGAELTDDYHERTSIFGYYNVAVNAASIGLSLLVLNVIFPSTPEFSSGLLNPERYVLLAGMGAGVLLIGVLVCTLGTADQIPYLHPAPRRESFSFRKHYGALLQLLRNPSYLSVCISWLTIAAAQGVLDVVTIYTYLYAYEVTTEQLSLLAFAKLPGLVVALPLASYMTRRFDKKATVVATAAAQAVLIAFPHVLRLAGFFPSNDSPLMLPVLFGPLFVGYALIGVLAIAVDSQLTDVTDDHEYRTGRREEGLVFSVREFSIKATEGVGGLIGGFGLDLIQFPERAEVGQVASGTQTGLLIMSGPLCLLIYAVGIGFMSLYRIDAASHQETLLALEERRVAADRRS